ncbi:hypothetical protein FOZ62_008963 [Perkinsus olseni]|uniref:Uncharacterized protein n=2 Tax=Perkinsus olseni TaxID=32597 RepID=A0A7J6PWL5_PEROL|nr:hypothetical protein FOZ62_008963 [Perkinsus olseni]
MPPTDGRRGMASSMDSLLKAAADAFSRCDWESAVFFSELAVALQPSDTKARESHCRSLFASGQYGRVVSEYKGSGGGFKTDSQVLKDLVVRAQVRTAKGDMPNFIPSSSMEWFAKGLMSRDKGDGRAAWQAFLESWRLNPLNIEAQRAVCHAIGGFYGVTSAGAIEQLHSTIASMSLDPSLEFMRKM